MSGRWKKTILFSPWCNLGAGGGQGKGRNSHTKISVKFLQPGLLSERFTKTCLNPLLTTAQTNSSPGPPVWPPCNLVCANNRKFPPCESVYDLYVSDQQGRHAEGRETKDHFTVHNLVLHLKWWCARCYSQLTEVPRVQQMGCHVNRNGGTLGWVA